MEKIDKFLKHEQYNLLGELNNAKSDSLFNEFVSKINVSDKKLSYNTSKLQDACREFNNCLNCKGLNFCKNEVKGFMYTYDVLNDDISFIYSPCRFNKEDNESSSNVSLYNISSKLKEARVKDIYTDDKSRIGIILYINDYIENYFKNRKKGLYLSGNFGSGKTYLIASLFNELAKKDVKSAIVYFPEFLRSLKASFNNSEDSTYSDRFNYIKKIPLLLIDDIGAENLTSWGRDEVLGTILQYRMEEDLPTFFTSNLNINDLEVHLSITNSNADKIKARRIIERIKYLTTEMTLIGIDRRK